jgi:hypothetical protein
MTHDSQTEADAPIDCADVVRAVADREGVDPSELEPVIHEVVDADALDALLSSGSGVEGAPVSVAFEFAGYAVSVRTDGEVTVERPSLVA